MSVNRGAKQICVLLTSLAAPVACGDFEAAPPAETIDVQHGAIIGGTNVSDADMQRFGLVAIYHPWLPTFPVAPRPCTGVILRSVQLPAPFVGWRTTILTAKHCTFQDEAGQQQATPDMLHVIPAANPGAATPNLPDGTLPASQIIALSTDHALIVVNANWSAIANRRVGVYLAAENSLAGTSLTAFGYGLTQFFTNPTCNSNAGHSLTTGAGTARSAGPFVVTEGTNVGPQDASYRYPNPNASGQRLTCGDSGGPDFANLGAGPFPWEAGWDIVLGVHTGDTSNNRQQVEGFGKDVQDALGGVYLSALNVGTGIGSYLNVAASSGNLILINPAGTGGVPDKRSVSVTYDVQTQVMTVRIPASGRLLPIDGCLSVRINSQQVQQPYVATCDTSDPGQRWTLLGTNLQVFSNSTQKCLAAGSALTVGLATCSSSSRNQRWIFHPQT